MVRTATVRVTITLQWVIYTVLRCLTYKPWTWSNWKCNAECLPVHHNYESFFEEEGGSARRVVCSLQVFQGTILSCIHASLSRCDSSIVCFKREPNGGKSKMVKWKLRISYTMVKNNPQDGSNYRHLFQEKTDL